MKKLLAMMLILLPMLVGCNGTNDVWLFSLGQTRSDVIKILDENRYRYKDAEKGGGIEGTQVVELYGIKWDGFALDFKDGKLTSISFRKADGEEVSEELAESVVKQLDKKYGEHREDRTAAREYKTVAWTWEKDNVNIQFARMFGGFMTSLIFFDEVEKTSTKPEAEAPVEEVVEIIETTE